MPMMGQINAVSEPTVLYETYSEPGPRAVEVSHLAAASYPSALGATFERNGPARQASGQRDDDSFFNATLKDRELRLVRLSILSGFVDCGQ